MIDDDVHTHYKKDVFLLTSNGNGTSHADCFGFIVLVLFIHFLNIECDLCDHPDTIGMNSLAILKVLKNCI